MEEILKLIEISRKRGQRSIQLVNQNFRKSEISKDNLLYEAAANGRFQTDEEVAKCMFNADPGNRNYRNTKGKLKTKLLNHLYFLDYDKESISIYKRQEYESLHTLHQCKILVEEGAETLAVKRLPQLIKTAKEFEFIDIAIEALEMLRNAYAKGGKAVLFREATKELQYLRTFRDSAAECEEIYYEAIALINKSVNARKKAMVKLPVYIDRFEKKAKEFNSSRIDVFTKKLKLMYNELSRRFKDNIKLCDQIEKEYLQDPEGIKVDLDLQELGLAKMISCFFQRDIHNGRNHAVRWLGKMQSGSDQWFSFLEYYFLLETAFKGYEKAAEIYRTVRTHKRYHQLPDEISARWVIYRAFLLYVYETKLLRWGFDIDEFNGKIPDFPRHLAGYNVATLVIQFMYLLRDGMVNDVRKRVNELQKYCSVHLDKRHNYRNSLFIRMLASVPEKEFNYELIAEKSNNYYEKLKKLHFPFDLKTELEVIPYETLWELITGILKENKLYIHYRFYNPA